MTNATKPPRHSATFHDSGRKAQSPPHPGFEQGLVFDLGGAAPKTCAVDLAWPAIGVGTWEVRCLECGVSAALTAAGRVDDPRRVVLPCGRPPQLQDVRRRAWTQDEASVGPTA